MNLKQIRISILAWWSAFFISGCTTYKRHHQLPIFSKQPSVEVKPIPTIKAHHAPPVEKPDQLNDKPPPSAIPPYMSDESGEENRYSYPRPSDDSDINELPIDPISIQEHRSIMRINRPSTPGL